MPPRAQTTAVLRLPEISGSLIRKPWGERPPRRFLVLTSRYLRRDHNAQGGPTMKCPTRLQAGVIAAASALRAYARRTHHGPGPSAHGS